MPYRTKSILASQFPDSAGCYIIRSGGQVLYVGQSKQLRSRWLRHHRRKMIEKHFPNATVEIVPCDESGLLQMEADLIAELRPAMNDTDRYKIMDRLDLFTPEERKQLATIRSKIDWYLAQRRDRPDEPSRYQLAMDELPDIHDWLQDD